MKCDNKKLKWIPFLSFFSLLIILCAVALWIFNCGSAIFGAITIVGILMVFPKRAASFENFWDTSIALGTHKMLIIIAFVVLVIISCFVIPNYQVVKKNKP